MRLIDPELTGANGLVPLTKLLDAVEQLPSEQQEAIAEELCAAQEAVYPPIAKHIRGQLEQAKADGDFPIQLIRAALAIGELTVRVLRLATDSTYNVRSSYWYAFGSLKAPLRSIKEGHFVIDRTLWAEQTAEWEVADRPLFLRKGEYNRFVRNRPPSAAQLRRAADTIVEECQGKSLGKKNFIRMMITRLPGCSKARAWTYAPKKWKKPGRPRRHSSAV